MIRVILVAVIPWACRIMKGIVLVAFSASACHLCKSLGTFSSPDSFAVFLQVGEVGICTEIIGLKCKADMGKIGRACAAGFIQSVFQFLDSTGNRIGRICDPLGSFGYWVL